MAEGLMTFAESIDVIEETYEFLLAYAAQGRRREEEEAGSNIRERLAQAEAALGIIASATMDAIPAGVSQGAAAGEFLDVVKADAARARAAFRFVLAQRSIGSQVVDNLNATTHVRTLLTDLFLLDEAAKISGI
jgi:FAD/FMN-containing dehydrogenase